MTWEARVGEIERRLSATGRALARLAADLAALRQEASRLGGLAGGTPSGGGGGGWFGDVATTLTARSGGAPGTGTVNRRVWDLATGIFQPLDTVSVLNLGTDQPYGAFVWIEEGADGQFYCSPLEC